jgi:DNA-binding MarR family transcriptional regulator
MKIEEEIKQNEFRNLHQKASINLVYTSNWLLDKQRSFFDRYDITQKQYNVLRILRGQYPNAISTSEIRSRMLDKSSDASRIVDRLAKQELITKRTCPTDKRLVDVEISEKGIKLITDIENSITELDSILQSLSPEEASELSRLLDKIRD